MQPLDTTDPFHPVSALFRLMEGPEFEELCIDIETYGLLEPIWLWQGQIIDGRNRYRACTARGVEPRYQEWNGQGSLVQFVISKNLHRRHLSTSERAMMGARAVALMEAEEEAARAKNGRSEEPGALMHPQDAKAKSGRKAQKAAQVVNVSRRSVNNARKVLEDGIPELSEAVDSGKITVTAAAKLAELTPEEQLAAIQDELAAADRLDQELDTREDVEAAGTLLDDCRKSVDRWQMKLAKAYERLSGRKLAFKRTLRTIERAQDCLAIEAAEVLAG